MRSSTILLANLIRVDDLQPGRQLDAQGLGHGLHFRRLGQQHAAGNAARLADGCGLHGARFAAFRQDDAFVRGLSLLDQLITERRR